MEANGQTRPSAWFAATDGAPPRFRRGGAETGNGLFDANCHAAPPRVTQCLHEQCFFSTRFPDFLKKDGTFFECHNLLIYKYIASHALKTAEQLRDHRQSEDRSHSQKMPCETQVHGFPRRFTKQSVHKLKSGCHSAQCFRHSSRPIRSRSISSFRPTTAAIIKDANLGRPNNRFCEQTVEFHAKTGRTSTPNFPLSPPEFHNMFAGNILR